MSEWDVEICDVTLRDGEQTPGVSFTCDEKMVIAKLLDDIGVEVIEAGFPPVSRKERECVKAISNMGLDARICCLSRAVRSDVDMAIDCEVDLVSLFFATSELHVKHKYHCTRDEMLERSLDLVDYCVDHGMQVRFAAEDASRTELDFLKRMYREGEQRGAQYSSFADTVGCLTPLEVEHTIRELGSSVGNRLCIHCHNDMGCATANTITAAEAGAFQLHTTVNGVGERAGNARLEEILVLLRKKGGVERYDLSLIKGICSTVEKLTNVRMPLTKPIVGKHAFAHESGIHIAAILEDPDTYEYIAPELVGGTRHFVLGKHTGMKTIRHVVSSFDVDLSEEQMQWVLEQIKGYSEDKVEITPEVLCHLIKLARGA